jgi:hypothetical protein
VRPRKHLAREEVVTVSSKLGATSPQVHPAMHGMKARREVPPRPQKEIARPVEKEFLTMTTCPICGAEAEELPPTGDFHGIHCPTHDKFEVSGTVMSTRQGKASPSLWERALERAKLRAASGKRPRIMDQDFL